MIGMEERPTLVHRSIAAVVVWVIVMPALGIYRCWLNVKIGWSKLQYWRVRRKLAVLMELTDRRHCIRTLTNGVRVYRIRLVGGPCDGASSICSGDTTYSHGERYVRGADDLYYHRPEGAGRN